MLSSEKWRQLITYIKFARVKTLRMKRHRSLLLKQYSFKVKKLDELKSYIENKQTTLTPKSAEDLRLKKLLVGIQGKKQLLSKKMEELNRPFCPRYYIDAKIYITKNNRFVKGSVVDISKSGVFVSVAENVFSVLERVQVQIRPKGSLVSTKAIATVVRYNTDRRFPSGYGLSFVR